MLNENSNIDKTYIFPNGIELKKDEVKRTLAGEFTMQKFISGYDLASRTSIINHLIKCFFFHILVLNVFLKNQNLL